MEFKELIVKRRSCRKYAAEPVDHEVIVQALKEAQMAPSWRNHQCARCDIVEAGAFQDSFRVKVLPGGNAKNAENAVLIITTYERGKEGFCIWIRLSYFYVGTMRSFFRNVRRVVLFPARKKMLSDHFLFLILSTTSRTYKHFRTSLLIFYIYYNIFYEKSQIFICYFLSLRV